MPLQGHPNAPSAMPASLRRQVRLAKTPCLTTSWASKTSLVCGADVADAAGVAKDVVVTAIAVAGTRTQQFTFDGAVPPGPVQKACGAGLARRACS